MSTDLPGIYEGEKARRATRRKRQIWALGLTGVFLVSCCGMPWYFAAGIGKDPLLWYGVGPAQVVGGPDEAWLFLERNIVVQRPGWGEHRALTLACRQQVVVITPSGIKERFNVPDGKEVTFHENLSRVFRHDGHFYQIHSGSGSTYGSLLRWRNDHFELLPLEAYDEFVTANHLDTRLPEYDQGLDQLTESDAWKHLLSVMDWFDIPKSFDWAGQEFELTVERGPPLTKLWIHCRGPDAKWEEVLMEFDPTRRPITWEEYDRWWNEPDVGHRRE